MPPIRVAAALIVTIGVMRWPMIPVVLCLAPLSVLATWLAHRCAAGGGNA